MCTISSSAFGAVAGAAQKRRSNIFDHRSKSADSDHIILQLGCFSSKSTQKINNRTNQKGYGNSETTIGKLLMRKIQIYLVKFCKSHFDLFFKITFQIMPEHHWTKQNRIRVVEYSSTEVSNPSEMPRFVEKFSFS